MRHTGSSSHVLAKIATVLDHGKQGQLDNLQLHKSQATQSQDRGGASTKIRRLKDELVGETTQSVAVQTSARNVQDQTKDKAQGITALHRMQDGGTFEAIQAAAFQHVKKEKESNQALVFSSDTAKAQFLLDVAALHDGQCAGFIRQLYDTNDLTGSTDGIRVKMAVRWLDEARYFLLRKRLFPQYPSPQVDKKMYTRWVWGSATKCSSTGQELAGIFAGIGKHGEEGEKLHHPSDLLASMFYFDEPVIITDPQNNPMVDFAHGRWGGNTYQNLALHIIFKDYNDKNENKLTHQFIIQKTGSAIQVWQSYIEQFTLNEWLTHDRPDNFNKPMNFDKFLEFVEAVVRMSSPDNIKDMDDALQTMDPQYESLFWIKRKSVKPLIHAPPQWKWKFHFIPYEEEMCVKNWKSMTTFAKVIVDDPDLREVSKREATDASHSPSYLNCVVKALRRELTDIGVADWPEDATICVEPAPDSGGTCSEFDGGPRESAHTCPSSPAPHSSSRGTVWSKVTSGFHRAKPRWLTP